MILNVGCGGGAIAGAVNLDVVPLPGVDVVHDLDVTPWPFEDGAFVKVRGEQVFEHVLNPVGFMTEAYRVLQSGGVLWLAVPHWKSENSYTDPTHVRHCTERTWDYWINGRPLHTQFNASMGAVTFSAGRVARYDEDIHVELIK